MRKIIPLVIGFSLLLFSFAELASAKTVRSKFQEAPPPPEGYALVYMYRLKTQPAMRKAKILVDGEKTTVLSNKSYTWFYLSPGSHTLRTKWGFMAADIPELEGVIKAYPNSVHYIKMSGSIRDWGTGSFTTYSGIKEVSQAEAMKDLAKTKKYNPAFVETVGRISTAKLSQRQQERAASFKYALPPQEGYSLVYFYRPKSPPSLKAPKVLVDKKEIFKLKNKSYTWLYIRAGQHTISTEWGWLGRGMNKYIKMNLASGTTYYLRFSGTTGSKHNTSLNAVDGYLAKKEFSKLKRHIVLASEFVQ